jgi:hypothetical protein
MSRGLQELKECFAVLIDEVKALRKEQDVTAPMTAEALCARWAIQGALREEKLRNLARRCREYGLQPMKGTRGWEALYARADVLSAESYAAGKSKRRRAA